MKNLKKLVLPIFFVLAIFASCTNKAVDVTFETVSQDAGEENVYTVNDKDIVILYSNDIHGGFKEGIGLSGFIKYYKNLGDDCYKIMVDSGDFAAGNSIGTVTKGEANFELMSKAGYKFIVPGNHEFDFGIEKFLSNSIHLTGVMHVANLIDLRTNEMVFDPYKIFTFGKLKVALIGLTSPQNYTLTTPQYYNDENGNQIYTFMEHNTGEEFYEFVQGLVDECKNNGADYVIIVGHIGETSSYEPFSSVSIMKNISGVDCFIDGHSHNIYNDFVEDKEGFNRIACEAGTKFSGFGKVTISKEGSISCEIIQEYDGKDEDTDELIEQIEGDTNNILKTVLRNDVKVKIATTDDNTGERIVRNNNANAGDFATDALRNESGTDVAILNAGALRDNLPTGDITLDDAYKVFPFANHMSTGKVTGQIIKDALEWGARNYPNEEGSFFHVSGITYTLDSKVPSSVVKNEEGGFKEVAGEYRVKDIMVNGEPLDPLKKYSIALLDYTSVRYGDGCSMFEGIEDLNVSEKIDCDVLTDYIKIADFDKYKNNYGEGRITILK